MLISKYSSETFDVDGPLETMFADNDIVCNIKIVKRNTSVLSGMWSIGRQQRRGLMLFEWEELHSCCRILRLYGSYV